MRYPDGGGLTAEGRVRREKLRLQAAQMFGQGIKPVRVARLLRVSTKSVYQWRRPWRKGGDAALGAACPPSPPSCTAAPRQGTAGSSQRRELSRAAASSPA
jgi:transposase-like protein